MTKISQKIASNPDSGFVSLEFFPPKTKTGLNNLTARIERLSILNPLFVSVTWGAGGSTAEKSLELASYIQNELGLTTCLHLTCTNTDKTIIDDALARAKEAGIQNILALRGDPPRNEVLNPELKSPFKHAVDLVRYIRESHGDWFDIGVAAYPDGHVEGSDSSSQSYKHDLPYLVEKVRAGADFIITQLFFDVPHYLEFEEALLSTPEIKNIPIIPGLIPINNYQLFQRVSKLSHAKIPKSVLNRFPLEIQGDDGKVKEIGVDVLDEIIQELYSKSKSKTKGVHFYTLNLESSIAKLVKQSKIIQDFTSFSKSEPVKHLHDVSRQDILAISTGVGTLGKEATWDEFPNGRFGDSRSPAYGEIDGYGPSLKIPEGVDDPIGPQLWGTPRTLDDLSELFEGFLSTKIPVTPFSDTEISSETLLIQEELFKLLEKHWYTLSSQPSVNGCMSSDEIFGWGARNGYVYQKAYVELLLPKSDWDNILKPRIIKHNQKCGEDCVNSISFYAASNRGLLDTNVREESKASVVTWGVFPNREIVETTFIERDSFALWADEAYKILQEWINLYLLAWKNGRGKQYEESYNLLKKVYNEFYLVTVFDNNFQEGQLWSFLNENQ